MKYDDRVLDYCKNCKIKDECEEGNFFENPPKTHKATENKVRNSGISSVCQMNPWRQKVIFRGEITKNTTLKKNLRKMVAKKGK